MIDHTRKLIFIHIARTGGTSIEKALTGKDWWVIEPRTKHISAKQARKIYGEDVWRSYTKFSVVRNPWDRITSMWATRWWHQSSDLAEGCTFEEFIRKIKPHPNEIYNTLFYHEILNQNMDFILRFESLQNDFSRMMSSIGCDGMQLPHIEKRNHENYRDMYGDIEKQLVFDLFNTDVLKYRYSYE